MTLLSQRKKSAFKRDVSSEPYHVVRSFAAMPVLQAFRNYFVKHHLHIVSHVWIPTLV